MVLDSYDLEFLKLCGLARYMPCSLADKYSLPMFGEQTTSSLLLNGYIKEVKGDCRCFRLKRKGRELLQGLGYDFPDDARPHKSGSIFKRRVISAELNLLLHTAGFNVYAKYMKHLEKDLTYLPSLTFRAVTKSKVLAGTRFYGMLRIGQTAYIIYHAENEADGIIPNYERDTFESSLSRVENIKKIVIIIAGRTMEGLTRAMLPEKKTVARWRLCRLLRAFEGMALRLLLTAYGCWWCQPNAYYNYAYSKDGYFRADGRYQLTKLAQQV